MRKRLLSFAAGVLCICCLSSSLAAPSMKAGNSGIKFLTAEAALVTKPGTVTGVKAVPSGKNRVKLTWKAVSGAQGYLIYAQKSNKYAYCGMTSSGSSTSFTDTKALDSDFNYYWVFAYVKDSAGKMIAGACEKYVYAKGICPAVTNLKASSTTSGVKLSWTKVSTADGYLIYGKTDSTSYGYKAMTSGNTWTDAKAPTDKYSYYWVFPYHKDAGGNMIIGGTAPYVYAKKTVVTTKTYSVEDFSFQIPSEWYAEEREYEGYPSYFFGTNGGYFNVYCQRTMSHVTANKFSDLIDEYIRVFYPSSDGWKLITMKTGSYSSKLLYADLQLANDEAIVKSRVIMDLDTWLFYEFVGRLDRTADATARSLLSQKFDEIIASLKYVR